MRLSSSKEVYVMSLIWYLWWCIIWPSAYEKGLPGLPGKSLGVGLKMVSDSKPVGEKWKKNDEMKKKQEKDRLPETPRGPQKPSEALWGYLRFNEALWSPLIYDLSVGLKFLSDLEFKGEVPKFQNPQIPRTPMTMNTFTVFGQWPRRGWCLMVRA